MSGASEGASGDRPDRAVLLPVKIAWIVLACLAGPLGLGLFLWLLLVLSDRYSPAIVKNDVDLGLLVLHRYPADSAVDGSGFLISPLIELNPRDSALFAAAVAYGKLVDPKMGG